MAQRHVAPSLRALARMSTALFAMVALTMTAADVATAAPPVKSILFVNPLPKYPAWRLIGDCVAQRAKKLGIPETETGSTTGALDQNAMLEQIEQGIADRYGAILTFPATSGFAPLLQQAHKRGILVGTFWGSAGTQSGSNVNVGANFAQVGAIFVEAIAGRPGEQHVGLVVGGPTGAGKAFVDGFKAAAAKTKNITVEAVVFDNEDASKALDLTNALLAAHPDINVIASHTGTATQGATAAIKSRGLVGKVVFVANGTAGGGLHGLDDGTVYKLMLQDLCGAGDEMVDAIAKIAAGEPVPPQIDVGIQMFGKSQVAPYLAKGWQ